MIVCLCHRVSDRDIAHAVRDGCASFDDLQQDLRVATACGACDDCSRQTFEMHRAQAPCAMRNPWSETSAAFTSSVVQVPVRRAPAP